MPLTIISHVFKSLPKIYTVPAPANSYTIPESKTVSRGALSGAAKVDFKKPHVPLLLTAGDTDSRVIF
jgi:hypothetical protein